MTFENFNFLKSMISQVSYNARNNSHGIDQNKSSTPSEFTSVTQSSKETKYLKLSDLESYITSFSKIKRKSNISTDIQEKPYSNDLSKPADTNKDENIISKNTIGTNNISNGTTKEIKSSESFLTRVAFNKQTNYFSSCKDSYNFKTLRLFNRNGKPLTDRMGRPLLGILGQPLVNIDDEGRLISDAKGNQVFNCLGESAIYSTTNLYVPPSGEEPGIPLLDIDRKHILFLYDNTGHPMTDSLGRPLLKASGNLMFGIGPTKQLDLNEYKHYSLKTIYSKAPLENFVRLVQIFDSNLKPLTDEYGKPLSSSKIICNKHGMPMCDSDGNSLFFKHATRVMTVPENKIDFKSKQIEKLTQDSDLKSSKDSFDKPIYDSKKFISLKEYCLAQSKINTINYENDKIFNDNDYENIPNNRPNEDLKSPTVKSPLEVPERSEHQFTDSAVDTDYNKKQIVYCASNSVNINPTAVEDFRISCRDLNMSGVTSNVTKQDYNCTVSHSTKYINFGNETVKHGENTTGEAVVLFDGRKKINNKKSSSNVLAIKDIRNGRIGHSFMKRKPYKNMFRTNFLQYFKNAVNMANLKYTDDRPIFNDYGKPMKDFYGSLLYDKYGIPLTGADGIKLSEKSRQILRLKLRNIPINKDKTIKGEALMNAFTYNKSCDQYGDPYYDKHGRPLYDLFGKLIYDIYGRPLTDAFNRPLIDAIGQPLMDSKGNVLTSDSKNSKTTTMIDVFGRHLYDKRGRALFDMYGRPRFDIYTNAVYDVCGRPATDGVGVKLYDFLNKAIQPYPEKPFYKNARALLPKYIDRILTTPSLHLVLKYSHASLKDVFGGPLFDDFGKPLYNKIGKPLYDKYGRPLYDKDGRPLCDRYGRPLSEEIRQSPDDTTVSVVDSLKLLKLTKESSMWMEIKRSQTQALKQTESGVLGKTSLKM